MPSRRYWAAVAWGVSPMQTAGGDGGEPVVDVVGVLDGGPVLLGPQVQGGRAGAAVDGQGAAGDLVETDAAAAGPGVVGRQGDMAGLVSDPCVGPGLQVDRSTDDREVAQSFGEAAGGGVVADEAQVGLGMLFVPATLELGGVPAEGGPGVADVQSGMTGGGLADEFVGAGEKDAGTGQDLYAGAGGGDAAAGAVQQVRPEKAFETGEGAGDGGLGDAEFVRRVGEAAVVDDGDQAPQLLQLQRGRSVSRVIHASSV